MTAMKWNEGKIGRILARNTFKSDLCVLPNCTWTGDEIDLLVVTTSRRVIDVEIKISRADLKKDADKNKWWQTYGEWERTENGNWHKPRRRVEWPRKVWKHYYAMPSELWHEDLHQCVNAVSGVLLIHEFKIGRGYVECVKRAKPCRNAEILSDEHVVQIARLASLRMWDAYKALENKNA